MGRNVEILVKILKRQLTKLESFLSPFDIPGGDLDLWTSEIRSTIGMLEEEINQGDSEDPVTKRPGRRLNVRSEEER